MRLACPLLILVSLGGCAKQMPVESPPHDLVVRGGTILDGSGGSGYIGDVVVDGDRIVYVGKSRGDAGKTVIGPSQSSALVRARAGKGLRAQKSRCVEYTANACAAPGRGYLISLCGAGALEVQ